MKTSSALIGVALVGVVFGVLANHSILLGSWLNLIVWAVVGLLLGFFIEQKRFVNGVGISYGFFLTLAFLISGFQGTADKIPSFALISFVLSILGAFCGWVLVLTASWIKMRLFRFDL